MQKTIDFCCVASETCKTIVFLSFRVPGCGTAATRWGDLARFETCLSGSAKQELLILHEWRVLVAGAGGAGAAGPAGAAGLAGSASLARKPGWPS